MNQMNPLLRLGQAMKSKDKDAIQKVVKNIIETTFETNLSVSDRKLEKFLVPFYAVETGNLPLLKLYIEDFKDDINQVNYIAWTLLHASINLRQYEMIDYLLAKRADVNKKDVLGQTPLISLLTYGIPSDESIVQSLLNSGADIEITDNKGNTALTVAKDKHLDNIVKILEEHAAAALSQKSMDDGSNSQARSKGSAKAASARPTSPTSPQKPQQPPKEDGMTTGEYLYLSLLLI